MNCWLEPRYGHAQLDLGPEPMLSLDWLNADYYRFLAEFTAYNSCR